MTHLIVIPLYPQFSISTSGSSLRLLEKMFESDPALSGLKHSVIASWYALFSICSSNNSCSCGLHVLRLIMYTSSGWQSAVVLTVLCLVVNLSPYFLGPPRLGASALLALLIRVCTLHPLCDRDLPSGRMHPCTPVCSCQVVGVMPRKAVSYRCEPVTWCASDQNNSHLKRAFWCPPQVLQGRLSEGDGRADREGAAEVRFAREDRDLLQRTRRPCVICGTGVGALSVLIQTPVAVATGAHSTACTYACATVSLFEEEPFRPSSSILFG